MPWKTFGSSGFDKQPRGHVRESFVRRCDAPTRKRSQKLGKTISRCDSLQWIFPHTTVAVDADFPECEPTHIMADGRRNARYPYQKVQHWDDGRFERKMGSLSVFTRASQESAALALNHYSVQSVEYNAHVTSIVQIRLGERKTLEGVQNKTEFHLRCSDVVDRELAQALFGGGGNSITNSTGWHAHALLERRKEGAQDSILSQLELGDVPSADSGTGGKGKAAGVGTKKRKHFLSVLSMFKDENYNIREWVEHYR
jgi:hypothetical protein